jgi:outer membrane protein assembly factor BamA
MGKTRKRVLDRSFDLDLNDIFDGRQIDDVIAELQALDSKVDYGRSYDAKFRVEYGYESTSVYMDVYRDETQKEFDARMLREERAKEKARKARETKLEKARQQLYQKEADERAEYERLKEKFGA